MSNQHIPNDLKLKVNNLTERRERVFFILAAIFICSMTLLNVIGLTRFVQLGPIQLAIGVLPYPLTFLCTDLISEFYGKARANFVVTVGLGLNFFILGIMWLGQALPAVDNSVMPPWQTLQLAEEIMLPSGSKIKDSIELFHLIYYCTTGAIFASMIAYITAQYIDVRLFHFWKKLTKGKHLWLRNNMSTLISQCVDSIMVISITFGATILAGNIAAKTFFILVASNYAFKLSVAIVDTLPCYFLAAKLRKFLQIDNTKVL